MLLIVKHIARTLPRRQVIVAHADRTAQDHALRQTVQRMGHQLDNVSSYTTSAAAPARRGLGAKLCPTAGPQHSPIVAVAVHHPDSIERRAWPCLRLGVALVGDLVA